ncbi:MAG: SLBB domain-containing protein [Candidatus Zixiibacteriota bacterium]
MLVAAAVSPLGLLMGPIIVLGLLFPGRSSAVETPPKQEKTVTVPVPFAVPVGKPAEEPGPTIAPEMPAYLDQVVDPAEYTVGPGDKLLINVWSERPDQFAVAITPEATVIVPNVGEIGVKGMTLKGVKEAVIAQLQAFFPRADISVTLTEVRRFRVTVTGAVKRPGLHIVTANTRASEVLETAGLRDDGSWREIRLQRRDTTIIVDLGAFERLGLREANPYLAEGDVLVASPRDPRWGTVEIFGSVNKPDRFNYSPGDLVGDLIELGYGLSADADTTHLELWRFAPGSNEAHRVEWPAGTTYSQWRQFMLLPDDRLIVRAVESFRPKRSVLVSGEVARPGRYIFPGETVSLRTVIDSAGGFLPTADLSHALILRSAVPAWSVEQRARLAKVPEELRERSESDWMMADALSVQGRVATDFVRLFTLGDESYNVPLIEGDEVIVPRTTESVNILGRVVQPGFVPHEPGAGLKHYLDRAGGYAWQADRRGTFLVRGATGAAVKRGRITKIDAGDTIVVPTKRGHNWWSAFRETMTVVSSLATVYLVVDQATK